MEDTLRNAIPWDPTRLVGGRSVSFCARGLVFRLHLRIARGSFWRMQTFPNCISWELGVEQPLPVTTGHQLGVRLSYPNG